MSIVGFNFTRISAERKNAVVGTVNITNNIALKDISDVKLGLTGDRGALKVSFSFRSEYNPQLAVLLLEGDVLMITDAKQQAALLEQWQKARRIPNEVATPVMNYILDRCNVQALLLSKDLGLPSPVPLPKVRVDEPAKAAAKPETKADAPMKSTKVGKKK